MPALSIYNTETTNTRLHSLPNNHNLHMFSATGTESVPAAAIDVISIFITNTYTGLYLLGMGNYSTTPK